jgi:hypothetical protein
MDMGCDGILLMAVLRTGYWLSKLADITILSQHTVKQFSASPVSCSKMS